MTSLLDDAVLLTLAYSDIFATPLTFSQIYQRLIGVKTTPKQLHQSLTRLRSQQRLEFQQDFYFLPSRQAIIKLHIQRQTISQQKLKRAKILAAKLTNLPSVLAIYLTGSLAVNNASPSADIDFLIITSPNWLWTTRFLLNSLLDIFHLRRKPNDQFSNNKLCLNLYLTPHSLTLPSSKRNLHSAYELLQLQPLFERYHFQSHFYQANRWLFNYLPNFEFTQPTKPLNFINSFNFFEPFLYSLQYRHMRSRITNELISRHYAFFHPKPLYPQIISQLRQRLTRYNIKLWPQLQPYLN